MTWVQPSAPGAPLSASARIAVAPLGKTRKRVAQSRRRCRAAPSTAATCRPAVDAHRVGQVDRRRREQRRFQRLRGVDARHAARRRAPRRRCARRRSARAVPSATAPVVAQRGRASPSVTIITSQGAPPSSASRIAPTAPKRPSIAAPLGRAEARAAAPRPGPSRRRRRAASGAQRRRSAVRAHCSGFAPEILTMCAHLAMSAWR